MSRHDASERAARDALYSLLRDEDDYLPDPEPQAKKTPCARCSALCVGELCRRCLPSGPDDRRVRSSK